MIVGTNCNSAIRIDFGSGDRRVYVQATLTGNPLEMAPLDRDRLFRFVDELKQLVSKFEKEGVPHDGQRT